MPDFKLEDLIPTHNALRDMDYFQHLLDGGRPLKTSGVLVAVIEGQGYVHDGHHRLASHILAKNPAEMDITFSPYSLKDYMIPGPPRWLTPFDPRTEVRLPEFWDFKELAKSQDAEWILAHRHHYMEPRRVRTMKELAEEALRALGR